MLTRIPSDYFGFIQKKRRHGFGYTTNRFFVIKSKYLLCYDKKRSEEYELLESYNQLKQIADDEPLENVKRLINLGESSITNSVEGKYYYITIKPSKGYTLKLRFIKENDYFSWLGILKSALQTVSIQDFQILKEIGSGAFGKVELARHIKSGKLYAIKTVTVTGTGRELLNQFIDERTIMQYLNKSDFIVHMECCFRSGNKLFYVLEYGNGGDLYGQLKKCGRFPESKVKYIAVELILAIGHMHHMNVLHRDIKPENILIDATGHIKLADFGLSKVISSFKGRAYSFCGTDLYRPPEMFTGTIGYTRSIDWWQCGCVIYELLTGAPPFKGHRESRRYRIINCDPVYPSYLSSQAVSLLKGMLTKVSYSRLGASQDDYLEILAQPFFEGIDIEKVKRRDFSLFDIPDEPIPPSLSRQISVHTNTYSEELENALSGFDYIDSSFLPYANPSVLMFNTVRY